ncbi:GNAT family N-acetyltransferase [Acidicapsa dinghuensis]|nr:GNAT family N-acetyltransferase [Acidicapsa dinghuensis]
MYWRIGAAYRKRPASENRNEFQALVREGPAPGLLAFAGELAVGWCQVTPRDALSWIDKTWRLKRADDVPVWAISCFYVRKGWRRKGVTRALIDGAVEKAKAAGAPAIEAYPLDGTVSPSSTSTGYASTFLRAGFREVARWSPEKPIMRYELRGK